MQRVFNLALDQNGRAEITTNFNIADCDAGIVILQNMKAKLQNGTWKVAAIEQGPKKQIPDEL